MAVHTLHDTPGDHVTQISFDAVSDLGATNYIAIWYAPFNCYVTAVSVLFTDAVTGQDTNTFHLNLDDTDRTTELANKDFTNTINSAAGAETSIYAPTAPGKSLSKGDNLYLERELIGNGMAMPEGNIIITYQGR